MYIYGIEWENPSSDKPESARINSIGELEAKILSLQEQYGDKIIKFSIA
jgi:hypothetical protein